VAAPAVQGAANTALVRLLASVLEVPASAISLVAGATGRRKLLEVHGLDASALRSRWPGLDV
jgi:uncharacterized protein